MSEVRVPDESAPPRFVRLLKSYRVHGGRHCPPGSVIPCGEPLLSTLVKAGEAEEHPGPLSVAPDPVEDDDPGAAPARPRKQPRG